MNVLFFFKQMDLSELLRSHEAYQQYLIDSVLPPMAALTSRVNLAVLMKMIVLTADSYSFRGMPSVDGLIIFLLWVLLYY